MEVTRRKRAHARWLALSLLSLLTTIIALGSAARARADANQDARTSFEQGVEASRAQRWEEARALFKRSLEQVPKPSTLFNLAIADIKLGHGAEALEELDALELLATPAEHAPMLERARILRAQAQALIDNKRAEAHGGTVLADAGAGLSDEVRRDVAAGREHYARGRDRLALAAFERAYAASRRPELLYNIAVVADRQRDDERAIRAYDQFVEALPDAPQASVAQVRSEALRASVRQRADEPASAPPLAPVSGPRRDGGEGPTRGLRTARALLVTGSVLAVGSIAAGVWLADRSTNLDDCENAPATKPCLNQRDLRDEKKLALVSTLTGAALAVGFTTAGVVCLVGAKQRARARESSRASLAVSPTFSFATVRQAGMSVTGHF